MSTTVELCAGDYRASIDLHGGGLRGLWHSSRPLVQTYPEGVPAPLSAGQVLAPWPNRTSDGVFAVDGTVYSLPINEPARNNAIHGVCNTVEWEVVGREVASKRKEPCKDQQCVQLRAHVGPAQGWPWRLEVSAMWALRADTGLSVEWTPRNLADQRQPFGLGWHPYLSALGAPLDECALQIVPAETLMPLDPRKMVPCGVDAAIPETWDFARGVPMAGVQMDHCLHVNSDRTAQTGGGADRGDDPGPSGVERAVGSTATLLNAAGEGVQLRADGQFGWYQVYVADPGNDEGYPDVGCAVAVEPMTCPADALRSGRGLVWLKPGESQTFKVELRCIGG